MVLSTDVSVERTNERTIRDTKFKGFSVRKNLESVAQEQRRRYVFVCGVILDHRQALPTEFTMGSIPGGVKEQEHLV